MHGDSGVSLLSTISIRFARRFAGLLAAVGLVLVTGCRGSPDTNARSADRGAADTVAGAAQRAATPGADTTKAGGAPAKPLIVLVRAADWMGSEWGEDAIKVGLMESDLQAGRDYELKISSAQGDLATLPNLIDHALDANANVIIALQDATLEVAVQRARTVPIVFNLLSDPFAAGAGKSDTEHLANVTGVYSPGFGDPEQTRRVQLIRDVVPNARRIGVLFTPEEKLSAGFKDRLTTAAQKAGLQVVAVPVSSTGEVGDATRSLCNQKVNAIELYGNVAHAGFPSLIQAANECRVPVFSPAPFEVLHGAVASFFPDFQEGGVEAGKMVARVLHGESPGSIPFHQLKTTKMIVNPGGKSGVTVPPKVIQEADTVVGERGGVQRK